jgi:hypothetical protein
MASALPIVITPTQLAGKVKINAVLDETTTALGLPVAVIAFSNDSRTTGSMIETPMSFLDDNEQLLSTFIIGSQILTLGSPTFLMLRYIYQDGASISSNILRLKNTDAPTQATLSDSNIRKGDGKIEFNLGLMGYTNPSERDGFSPITKVKVYYSIVDGAEGEFKETIVNVVNYDEWIQVQSLINTTIYEVAIAPKNDRGDAPISNTVTRIPQDTPDKIALPATAIALMNYQKYVDGKMPNDPIGDIVVLFNDASDFASLKPTANQVSKYTIMEQQYVKNDALEDVAVGIPVPYIITPTSTPGASGSLIPILTFGTRITGSFDHKYIIAGSPDRVGKMYKYKVFGTNANGDGPSSNESALVQAFTNPTPVDFSLIHNSTNVDNIDVFDGKITLNVSSLPSTNGADQLTVAGSKAGVKDILLHLKIEDLTTPSAAYYYNNVKFVQEFTTTSVSGSDVYRGTGVYKFEKSELTKGHNYKFSVQNITADPIDDKAFFMSDPTSKTGRSFTNPSVANLKLESYALNDDFTPVSNDGKPAVRVLFRQMSDFGGLESDSANRRAEYILYQSGAQADVANIAHDFVAVDAARAAADVAADAVAAVMAAAAPATWAQQDAAAQAVAAAAAAAVASDKEFVINRVDIGLPLPNFISVKVWSQDLLAWVYSTTNSKAVVEAAVSHPAAATAAFDSSTTTDGVVSLVNPQDSVANRGGFPATNVKQRVLIYNAATQQRVHNSVMAAGATAITGWVLGSTYTMFVIAEGLYTKVSHINSAEKRFDNSIVRKNMFTSNFVHALKPTIPQRIEPMPQSGKIMCYWDAPADFNGVKSDTIKYEFYLNKIQTGLEGNLPVASSSGTSSIVLTKAFPTAAEATDLANLLDIVDNTSYWLAVAACGTTGGFTVGNTNYSNTEQTKLNGSNTDTVISLIANSQVPLVIVKGVASASVEVFPGAGPDAIQGLTVSPGAAELTVVWLKDLSGRVTNIDIDLEENDGFSSDVPPVPVAKFSTKSFAGGLAAIDATPTLAAAAFFTKTIINGKQQYSIKFKKLVNGNVYRVNGFNIFSSAGNDFFSQVTTIDNIAPEAPPTEPQLLLFAVENGHINASWSKPLSDGGAGVNTNKSLSYRLTLTTVVSPVSTVFDTPNLSYSIPAINGTDYTLTIVALYLKADELTEVIGASANFNSGKNIRPHSPPLGPSATTTVANNSISYTLAAVSTTESMKYPAVVRVFRRLTGTSGTSAETEVFSSPISGLLNAQAYDLIFRSTPSYDYAQAAADFILYNLIPFGQPTIKSIEPVVGQTSQRKITVDLNGSGEITTIIALGKADGSNNIAVVQKSGASLPTFNSGGSVTGSVVAGQERSFNIDMTINLVTDVLAVINTLRGGSDALAVPYPGFFSQANV